MTGWMSDWPEVSNKKSPQQISESSPINSSLASSSITAKREDASAFSVPLRTGFNPKHFFLNHLISKIYVITYD